MNTMSVLRDKAGRPFLMDAECPGAELSISNDGDFALATVGYGPQGCDIQTVEARRREEWLALLGSDRACLLNPLIDGGDTLDQAGTRLWSAVECGIKALGAPAPQELRVLSRRGSAVLFEIDHPTSGPWQVFTSVVSLEADAEHVFAAGLEGGPRTVLAAVADDASAPTAESDKEAVQAPGRAFTQPFTVLVRDAPKALDSAHYPSFAHWMGASREEALRSASASLDELLGEDKGKMVSTSITLRTLAPAKAGDRLVAVLTTASNDWERGPYTFLWSFHLGDGDGPVAATGTMDAVWISPTPQGTYALGAPPAAMRTVLESLASQDPAHAGPQQRTEPGRLLATAAAHESLAEAAIDVTVALEETDFQGHANFVNYFRWQATARDALLDSIGLAVVDSGYVPVCISTEMNYLREVMPFERLRVVAQIESVYSDGFDVRFSFMRRNALGATTDKVAFGRHRLSLRPVGSGHGRTACVPPAVLAGLGALAALEMAA